MHLRTARPHEAAQLSDLALRSKGRWGYDAEFLESCRAVLTLTPAELVTRRAVVAERGDTLLGFYTLSGEAPVAELTHLFIDPPHIGGGVGSALWRHAVDTAAALGIERMTIDADPFAEPFYLAKGAVRTGESPSDAIPGRMLPQLTYAPSRRAQRPSPGLGSVPM